MQVLQTDVDMKIVVTNHVADLQGLSVLFVCSSRSVWCGLPAAGSWWWLEG
jgi:hypothetical protein